jgi:hypothetical protein
MRWEGFGMALATEMHVHVESKNAMESIRAFAHLFGAICTVPSVERVALSADADSLDLWVLLREESIEDETRIILLERDYQQADGTLPLEVHVFPLTEVAAQDLPAADVLFERA